MTSYRNSVDTRCGHVRSREGHQCVPSVDLPSVEAAIEDPELLEALTSTLKKYEIWGVLSTLDQRYTAKEVWRVPVPVAASRPKCVLKAEEQTQLKEGIEKEIEKEIKKALPYAPCMSNPPPSCIAERALTSCRQLLEEHFCRFENDCLFVAWEKSMRGS